MKKLLSLILTLCIAFSMMLSLVSCDEDSDGSSSNDGSSNSGNADLDYTVGSGACEYLTSRSTAGRELRYIKISVKDHGSIILLLDATTAPVTVTHFMKLVSEGFYDGLTFHRILSGFMIQGGDPEGNGSGGYTDEDGNRISIKGEFSENDIENDISHKRGVISMARAQDMDSASSQFFICNQDSEYSLDGKYAAFGYVIAGLDVVDSITDEGMKHTNYYYNGMIYNKEKQPVITKIVEITKEEAMQYVK